MGVELAIAALAFFFLNGRGDPQPQHEGGHDPLPSPDHSGGGGGIDVKTAIGVGTSVLGSVATIAGTVAGALGGAGAATAGTVGTVSAVTTTAATTGAAATTSTAATGTATGAAVGGGLSLGAAAGIYAAIVAVLVAIYATGLHFGTKAARWGNWVAMGRTGAKRRAKAIVALGEWDLFESLCIRLNPSFRDNGDGTNNYENDDGTFSPNFRREYVSYVEDFAVNTYVPRLPALPYSAAYDTPGLLAVARAWAVERRWAYEQTVHRFYTARAGGDSSNVESSGIALAAGGFWEAVEEYCATPSATGLEPVGPLLSASSEGYFRPGSFSTTVPTVQTGWERVRAAAAAQLLKIGCSYEADVLRAARLDGQARGLARCAIDDGILGEYYGQGDLQYSLNLFTRCGLGLEGWYPPSRYYTAGRERWLSLEPGREWALDIQECQRLSSAVRVPAARIVDPATGKALA